VYLEFYGLAEGPFGLTPDPKYLFLSVGHKEALAHIHYGIEERRGFVLILGEVGTGKTTLIRHVLKRFGPDVKSVFLFNSSLGFEELLQAVLRDLEVPSPSHRRVDLIDALNEFLLQESQEGRRVVLIIDEAQNLSASVLEEIRMLSNLETARSKLLQIVLVGQPELGERLGQVSLRQLRQRIGLVAELKPLSRKDSVLYVKHRLKVAGARENIFTPLALRSVYRTSNGIPRLINVLCDKSLVLGYASNKKRIGRRIVRRVAGDWAVFRTAGRPVSAISRRRGVERRPLRQPLTRMVVVAAGGTLVVTGLLVGRLGTPDQTGNAVGVPSPAVTSSPPADARAASEHGPPPLQIATPSGEEPPTSSRITKTDRVMDQPGTAPSAALREGGAPLAVPALPERPGASVVTVKTGDTLSWLLYSVYGRADETVIDLAQAANPSLNDVDELQIGQRLRFPRLEAAAMIHKAADGRYRVHLLTTSKPMDKQLRKLRAEIVSRGQTVHFEPVHLGNWCTTCYRVWVGNFSSSAEAETFYRRMYPREAA
jgi:general secretion pathway protein A